MKLKRPISYLQLEAVTVSKTSLDLLEFPALEPIEVNLKPIDIKLNYLDIELQTIPVNLEPIEIPDDFLKLDIGNLELKNFDNLEV